VARFARRQHAQRQLYRVPNGAPPGHFFAPSRLRFLGARRASDGVGQANGKLLLLSAASTIETEGLFLDVFHQDRAGAWRELRGPQHAFNDCCREPRAFVTRFENAVLRESPSASACSSSERNPASIRACPSSRILADWRAFISERAPGLVLVEAWLFRLAATPFASAVVSVFC
jgi:hypothetical protein